MSEELNPAVEEVPEGAAPEAPASAAEPAKTAKRQAKAKNGAVEEVPEGYVALQGANCSCDSENYVADKNGVVMVKEEHADLLVRDFGFERL